MALFTSGNIDWLCRCLQLDSHLHNMVIQGCKGARVEPARSLKVYEEFAAPFLQLSIAQSISDTRWRNRLQLLMGRIAKSHCKRCETGRSDLLQQSAMSTHCFHKDNVNPHSLNILDFKYCIKWRRVSTIKQRIVWRILDR